MGVIGWSMLFLHGALFVFLRKRYLGKKKAAEKLAAELKVENIHLKNENVALKRILGE